MKRKLLFLLGFFFISSLISAQQFLNESFEGAFPPTGWSNADWDQSLYGAAHTGDEWAYSNTTGSVLTTLQVNASSNSAENLKFWYRCESSSYPQSFDVMVGTDIIYQVIDYASITYLQADISLAAYDGQTIQIKFVGQSGTGGWDYGVCLDDVTGPEIFVPACPPPTAQTETNITSTSADLGWTESGSATSWDIEYGATPYTFTGTPTISGVTNPYNLTGLSANTEYTWKVRADCGGDVSDWTGSSSFTTACAAKTAPWSDDFEAHTVTTNATWGNCWSASPAVTTTAFRWDLDGSGSTPSGSTGPDAAHSGVKYAYTEASSGASGDFAELYSPYIDISGLTTPALTFYYYMYGATMGNLYVDIHDGTSWNNAVASISGQQQTSGSQPWLEQFVDISSYSGTIQVRFRGERGADYTGDMAIDDFSVAEAPSCPAPTAQAATPGISSAILSWTENGTATTWDIELGTDGFTPTGTPTQTGVTNPYTYTGLMIDSDYDWYVRSDCGSTWTGPHSFTTSDGKATNPTPADGASDIAVTATTLDWDDVGDATSYTISIGTTTGGTDIVNEAACPTSEYIFGSDWDYSIQYFWTVTTVYSGGSAVGTEWDFTTECEAYTIPYTEGFETGNTNGTAIANCWTQESVSGSDVWTANNTSTDYNRTPRTGSWNAYLHYGDNQWMFQEVALVGGTSYTFEMYARQDGATAANASITVGYGDNPNAAAMTNAIVAQTGIINGNYQQLTGAFTPATSGNYFIGINGNINGTPWYISIDDISIIETPSCVAPTTLISSNETTTGADLAWTDASGSHWDLYIVATGDPAPDAGTDPTINDITANPYTWTGGTAAQPYDWYVRSDCGQDNTDVSPWTGPDSFTTLCNAFTAPYSQNFDAVTAPALPNCWSSIVSSTSSFAKVENSTTSPNSTPNNVYLYNSDDASAVLLLISPEFSDLTTQARRIKFFAKGGTGYNVVVGTMSDPSDEATFTAFETVAITSTYTQYAVDFNSSYTDTDTYIAFKHGLGGTYRSIYIDDVTFELIPTSTLSWYNLQWPGTGEINEAENLTVYSQCWEDGVTGQGTGGGVGIQCWIGYSTDNTNPNTWTNWVETTFNRDAGNNDEYMADLGADQGLTAGTYYYASRYSYLEGPYTYGGYTSTGGGPWDGTTNISGVLTVNSFVISTFPYSESFDEATFAPAGWTNVHTAGTGSPGIWDRQTTGTNPTCTPHSGAAMARYNCYSLSAGNKAELVTPSITFPADNYYVSFWMYRDNTYPTYGDEAVNVYYNTSASSSGGTLLGTVHRVIGFSPVVSTEGWYKYTFTMPTGATGSGRYIIFEAVSQFGNNIFMDDVVIDVIPNTYTWSGASDNDWHTLANWDYGVPTASTNVIIPADLTNYPTIASAASCNNLTIESSATGSGSLLGQNYLTVNGTTTIERYATAGTWHGISGPLDNDDFNSLYFGGSPNVWAQTYLEASNTYDPVTSLSTDLGDAKGWMVWIGGATAQTFEFTGNLRSSLTPVTVVNSVPDADHGYNFVGNPYPSAIDWDAATGWTKTNVDGGIWIWNPAITNWSTYNVTGGTNLGTQYIPIGQGFFVQVNESFSTGTLGMTTEVQVHNDVAFMAPASLPSNLIKLKLVDGEKSDESIIQLNASATEGYDGQFDMHKMFSWNEEQPQIYSTANNFMAVNVLPEGTVSVPMDVRGVDGNEMTISLEAISDFDHVYLSDNFTGVQTELTEQPYTFIYDASQIDRFTIYFTIVSTTENALDNIRVYGFDKQVRLEIPMQVNVNVEVVNMLGQTVRNMDAHMGTTDIHLDHGGYYLVKITGDNQRVTRKVFIR